MKFLASVLCLSVLASGCAEQPGKKKDETKTETKSADGKTETKTVTKSPDGKTETVTKTVVEQK